MVRLFPLALPNNDWTIDDLKTAIGHELLLDTVHGEADASLVAPDGIGMFPMFGKETYAVSFLSRHGEIWSIDSALCYGPGRKLFALTEVRKRVPQMLANFAQALMNLGVPPPYKWVMGLEGAKGVGLSYELSQGRLTSNPRLIVDEVVVEGVYADGGDISDAVERFTKRLFGECSRPVPDGLIQKF